MHEKPDFVHKLFLVMGTSGNLNGADDHTVKWYSMMFGFRAQDIAAAAANINKLWMGNLFLNYIVSNKSDIIQCLLIIVIV